MDSVVTHDVSHQEMNKEWCSYSKKNTQNSMEHIRKLLTLVVRLPGVPGSPRRTRRWLPGVPGSKKKKKIFFFFKMFNGKDSDMLVVIVGQYCSA